MQKDFHYCTIKTLACKAGLSESEAQIMAYASQYVDDAVEFLKFTISGLPSDLVDQWRQEGYDRIDADGLDPTCTAHKGIQFLNGVKKDAQLKVYIPFHFVPHETYKPNGAYTYTVVPDSNILRELLAEIVPEVQTDAGNDDMKKKCRSLIRLGIVLHSFADTWSHQKFSGRHSARDNDIERIRILEDNAWNSIPLATEMIWNLLPDIGHAEAGDFPDRTNLIWKYEHDYSGIETQRDNTSIALDAAYATYAVLCDLTGKRPADWKSFSSQLKQCFALKTDSMKEKFATFKNLIAPLDYSYDEDEWRTQALEGESFHWNNFTEEDYAQARYQFKDDIRWLYFHRESYRQRLFVLQRIRRDLL